MYRVFDDVTRGAQGDGFRGLTAGDSRRAHRRCTIYIMRRTQLYLDDPLWKALHARARTEKTTISELVRQAARERYLGGREEQRKAMQEFVGSRKRRSDPVDSAQYIRDLRRGDRIDRLHK